MLFPQPIRHNLFSASFVLPGHTSVQLPACQPEENPVLLDSFTQIYIIFLIGFRIDPPKMHRRFRIGLPKILRWFCIGPPESVLALRYPYWPSWIRIAPPESVLALLKCIDGEFWSPVYYERKALKKPIWNGMAWTNEMTNLTKDRFAMVDEISSIGNEKSALEKKNSLNSEGVKVSQYQWNSGYGWI